MQKKGLTGSLLISKNVFFYLLLRDHTTITPIPRSAPTPLFDTKKPLKKQTFHNIVFLVICMSPGPQKLLQNVIFPRLGSSIFRFFSFSAELWFRTTLPWFCCFFGFRVSLFRCRRYPKPDKTHSCCSGGSEPHFQHAFSENPSKNDIKMELLFRTGLSQFSTILRHRSLSTVFGQSCLGNIKKDILMTLFLSTF